MQIYEKFKNYETFLASFTYDIIKQRRKANRIGNIQISMSVLDRASVSCSDCITFLRKFQQ